MKAVGNKCKLILPSNVAGRTSYDSTACIDKHLKNRISSLPQDVQCQSDSSSLAQIATLCSKDNILKGTSLWSSSHDVYLGSGE